MHLSCIAVGASHLVVEHSMKHAAFLFNDVVLDALASSTLIHSPDASR